LSHGSSSVNKVTHCRHEHGIRVMSVPQKHPLGTEGVETALQMRTEAAERVFVLGVAGLPGRRDRNVRVFGQSQQFRLQTIGRLALLARGTPT
jgi:hypothetical protein